MRVPLRAIFVLFGKNTFLSFTSDAKLEVATEDLWCGLVGEFVDEGELFFLDELDQSFGSFASEVDAAFIELKFNV